MTFLKFFNTAPRTKSKTVTDLEKAGKTSMLKEAIEAERKRAEPGNDGHGKSGDGRLTVTRVGSHS